MNIPTPVAIDPVLPPAALAAQRAACERFAVYRTYGEERGRADFARHLPERYELLRHMRRPGGPFGRGRPGEAADAETHYERTALSLFRGTFVRGMEVLAPGFEALLHHEGFVEAARRVHERPLIVPQILLANLLAPGQELTNHTDVPAFRGVHRANLPHWLLIIMHHSGLFEAARIPITTVIAWFHDATDGGAFAFYPDGPAAPAEVRRVGANTALALDTDTIFHRVDRVALGDGAPIQYGLGMELRFDGEGRWQVVEGAKVLGDYAWEELRLSISWKAFGFRDEAERRAWEAHSDDLTTTAILDQFEADLRARGALSGPRPDDAAFADLMIDTYIRIPDTPPA